MYRIIMLAILVFALLGCAEKPMAEYYVYETMTGLCFKVHEFKDRLDYWDIDCREIPKGVTPTRVPEWEERDD